MNLISDTLRLKKILSKLPKTPGVYLMKNEEGQVLYVGKAKMLSNRVKHYFQSGPNHSGGTRVMMPKIYDIETVSVRTELEALLLETNLIKEHKPRYNVLMRDDKNYAYLKVTTSEDYPKFLIVRKREKDKAFYFGPFMTAKHIEDTLDMVKKIFPYRSCGGCITWEGKGASIAHGVEEGRMAMYKANVDNKNLGRSIPCLEYHIKRCSAPCLGIVSKEEYLKNITKIVKVLKGDFTEVISTLQDEMKKAVSSKNFEYAAKVRDQMLRIESIQGRQSVVSANLEDLDVIAYASESDKAVMTLIQIRAGKMLHVFHRQFVINEGFEISELFNQFFIEYYSETTDIPSEIFCESGLEEEARVLLETWFQESLKVKVSIFEPQKGAKKDLIMLTKQNAEQYLSSLKVSFEETPEILGMKQLQEVLDLEKLPNRIECYDISHLQGTNTVASMVVLLDGKTANSHYRRFQVKTLEGTVNSQDDYESLREVLKRRLAYLASKEPLVKITVKKATKAFRASLIENRYEKDFIEALDWFQIQQGTVAPCLIVGVQRLGEDVVSLSTYIEERTIDPALKQEMLLEFLYSLSEKHVYISTVTSDVALFLSMGGVEIQGIPEKYGALAPDGDHFLVWYRPSKKRKKADESFTSIPDILVIDGGKGQVNAVAQVMIDMKLEHIKVIGLAKREEEIFLPFNSSPILLPETSLGLRLLVRARDEAHRFAKAYHKEKREKGMMNV